MMVDAIIPAWNEAATIGPIVSTLTNHPGIHHVWVMLDLKTTDDTAQVAKRHHARVIEDYTNGKGQCVMAGLQYVDTPRVLFCDADLTGLTADHVTQLIMMRPLVPMVIGIPDFPKWEDIPPNFSNRPFIGAWPWMSGERCMSSHVAKNAGDLYGYLMETQLNTANHKAGRPVEFVRLEGCQSPLDLNEQRLRDMHRHMEYGKRMGVL